MKSFPTVYNLDRKSNTWTAQPKGCFLVSVRGTMGIKCSRINITEMIQYYLESSLVADWWPKPPSLQCIHGHEVEHTVVMLLSIDSGAGTTKLLGKLLRDPPTQDTREIILIAEAHDVTENFKDLYDDFGWISDQLKTLLGNGVSISGIIYRVRMFFVGDLMIYYSLLGVSNDASSKPCFWCQVPKKNLDEISKNMLASELQYRSKMEDFQSACKYSIPES